MLTVLTALLPRKAQAESIDRDPGIVSFLTALVGASRRAVAAAKESLRASHQRANEAELFSSSNAWPHNHRSN